MITASKMKRFLLGMMVCAAPMNIAYADDDVKAIIGGLAGSIITHAIDQAKNSKSAPTDEIHWNDPTLQPAPSASVPEETVQSVEQDISQSPIPTTVPTAEPIDASKNFWTMSEDGRKMEIERLMYEGALGKWSELLSEENNAHLYLWASYTVYIRIKAYYEAMEGESQVYVTDLEFAKSKAAIKEIESGLKALHPVMKTDDVWDVAVEDLGNRPRDIKGSPYSLVGIERANGQITTLTTMSGFINQAQGKRDEIEKDF